MLKIDLVKKIGIDAYLATAPRRVRVAVAYVNDCLYIDLLRPAGENKDELPEWVTPPDPELAALIAELTLNGYPTYMFSCQGGEGHYLSYGYLPVRFVVKDEDFVRVAAIVRQLTDVPFEILPYGQYGCPEIVFAGPVTSKVHLD